MTFEPKAEVTYANVQGGLSESTGTADDRRRIGELRGAPTDDDEETPEATVKEPVNFKLELKGRPHRHGFPRRDYSVKVGPWSWYYGKKANWNWVSHHYSSREEARRPPLGFKKCNFLKWRAPDAAFDALR